AELARAAGFARLKLYLMLGLPGEEDSDLDELVLLAGELSRIIPMSFGCAPFVAKRNTPMDGAPFVPIEETERRVAYLRGKLRGRAEIRPTSPRWAWVEYMLAQGGEEAGLAALEAWRNGGTFAAWKRAFRAADVKPFVGRRVPDGRLRLPQLAAWPSV
ncbi:MAG TPA: radical SAM protein, partial [Myxococcales bacterium]|nr:radical SAM protein [Myxococcales bacterium]